MQRPCAPPLPGFDEYLEQSAARAESELGKLPPQLGYPLNMYALEPLARARARLAPRFLFNSVGDPFACGESAFGARTPASVDGRAGCEVAESPTWRIHTLEQERELIEKELAPSWLPGDDGDASSVWGYVTTGGTEGVYRGTLAGLHRFQSHRTLFLYSDEAHYSVTKALDVFHVQLHSSVPCRPCGAIDLAAMRRICEDAKRHMACTHFLMICTLGTTFKYVIQHTYMTDDA